MHFTVAPVDSIASAIAELPWLDTHEHLVEEANRLTDDPYRFTNMLGDEEVMPPGWPLLICEYALDDLRSAGLPADTARAIRYGQMDALESWLSIEDYVARSRNTGYLRNVDLTTEQLFGLRLSRDTCEEIDERLRALRRPGYYRTVLDVAGVSRCQVQSVEDDLFCSTASPDLLDHDLTLTTLCTGRHDRAARLMGIEVATLDDYVAVIEGCFATFGPRAVAAKTQSAYLRPLAFSIGDAPPREAFQRLLAGEDDLRDRRRVEDFLFATCVSLAVDFALPIKVHTGTLAGNGHRQLSHVLAVVGDITKVVQHFPRAQFVFLHSAWPEQEALLALAKHQPNVAVELSWVWMLAPASTVTFVERFLTTVPASKLICFGGDSGTVENVVGSSALARHGLAAALSRLVRASWLSEPAALELIPMLMRENAERILPSRIVAARDPRAATAR